MGTPILNQAGAVLDALTEGALAGMFQGIKAVAQAAATLG